MDRGLFHMILHIDMDAFFASIEQAINPRLRGRPMIVGSREGRLRTVVCAASYEAKALGIDSGMPSFKAFKLCPNLEFVAADQSKYIWTSEQIFTLLKGYGFELVYASIDEFQMDIGDFTDPESLACDIQKRIREAFKITASVGVAKNSLLSKLASKINKPNGRLILTPLNLCQVLAQTPVKKLCGIGERTDLVLDLLGVKTCLDLYKKSAHFLEQNFGKYGLNLYQSLHSIEHFQTQETEEKPKSIGHSYTLPRVSENTGFIQAWIRLLSEMVARRLREQNLTAKTIHLWLDGPEMGNFGAQETSQQDTDDGWEIYRRCLKIMAKMGKKGPKIRALGITCSSLFSHDYDPLFKEEKRREDLLKAVDKINAKLGDDSIYPAQTLLTRRFS